MVTTGRRAGSGRTIRSSADPTFPARPVRSQEHGPGEHNHCVTELTLLQRLDPRNVLTLENGHESDFSVRLPAAGILLDLVGGGQGMH